MIRDDESEPTPVERREAHERRLAAVEEAVRSLPPPAQAFATKYRRHIELCGRAGPGALALYETFVEDLRLVLGTTIR